MPENIPLKTFLAGAMLATALFASSSCLADSSGSSPTDWSGPYIGIHGGGIFAGYRNSAGVTGPSGTEANYMEGGQAGYNFQIGSVVLGAEADASAMNLPSKEFSAEFREDWMATLRGRLGYSLGRLLPYVTAGLGVTNLEAKIADTGSDSKLREGLAGGVGLDGMLAEHWVARVEYLYVDVPKDSFNIGGTELRGGSENSIVRAALNYRFE